MVSKHTDGVVVIGMGRFGKSLALELMKEGTEVLGIDADRKIVESLSGRLTHAVIADSTNEDAMRQLAVHEFDRAVIGVGNDLEASILSASVVVRLAVPNVWAKAISNAHAEILRQIGVHHVVRPEHDMGKRVAHLVRGRSSRRRAGAGKTAAQKATVERTAAKNAPPKKSTTRKAVATGPATSGTVAEPGTATKAAASKAPAKTRTVSKSATANGTGLKAKRVAAKKANPTKAKVQPPKPTNVAPPGQSQTIRAWARSRGMQVADAGRMSAAVIAAYDAQHN